MYELLFRGKVLTQSNRSFAAAVFMLCPTPLHFFRFSLSSSCQEYTTQVNKEGTQSHHPQTNAYPSTHGNGAILCGPFKSTWLCEISHGCTAMLFLSNIVILNSVVRKVINGKYWRQHSVQCRSIKQPN